MQVRDSVVTYFKGEGAATEAELQSLAVLMGHSSTVQAQVYDRRTKDEKVPLSEQADCLTQRPRVRAFTLPSSSGCKPAASNMALQEFPDGQCPVAHRLVTVDVSTSTGAAGCWHAGSSAPARGMRQRCLRRDVRAGSPRRRWIECARRWSTRPQQACRLEAGVLNWCRRCAANLQKAR